MSNNGSTSSSNRSNGIGFTGALFLVFLVLKLTHVIDWSWWWITAPLWGGLVLFVAIFLIALAVIGIIKLVKQAKVDSNP